jgi:hypothetical protein
MDILSHALWGYASLRWRGPRSARWGALAGAAPDLLFGAGALAEHTVRHGLHAIGQTFGIAAYYRKDGPPMPPELLDYYHHFYAYSHSLVILGAVALAWWTWRRRSPWLAIPYGLHILMDMPTHERYQTPFLFPLSSWTFEGYAWGRPPVFLANWLLLFATYQLLYWRYWRAGRPARTRPWPEDVLEVRGASQPGSA